MKKCPQCGQILDENVQFCPADGAKPIQIGKDKEEDPMVGIVLGSKYRIEKKIGEGGMGKIYLARHVTLGKRYAIKMLTHEFSNNQEAIERFRREAVTAGELEHPNIINVTDIDYTHDGQAYIVMEFLEGRELREILRETPIMPIQRALRILYQVARALDAAHAKGIIHRDLKPENIFVIDRQDQKDVIKILDFGISKIKGARSTNLTQTGVVIGTPHYMAPEQARGEKEIDHRVDIYALGSIAYEALTGKLPVDGESVTAILMKILLEEPPSPETINPNIPPSVSAVLKKAMRKDPRERFGSCLEFVEALRAAAQVEQGALATSSYVAASVVPQAAQVTFGAHPQPMTLQPFPPGVPSTRPQPTAPLPGTPPPATGVTPLTWGGTAAIAAEEGSPREKRSKVLLLVPVLLLLLGGITVAAYFLLLPLFEENLFKGIESPAKAPGRLEALQSADTLTTAKETTAKEDKGSVETTSKGATSPKEEKAVIKFHTDPAGATVMLKIGVVERELCKTPCKHEFTKGDKKLRFVFSKADYQDEEIEITADVPEKEVMINLTKKGKKKREGPSLTITTPFHTPPDVAEPKKEKKVPTIRLIEETDKSEKEKKPVIKIIRE